jgi:hypothetical protein
MSKILQYALALAALVVAGAICFTCWRVSVAVDQIGTGTAQTLATLNATLDAVNRPCGKGKPCGTLAKVDQTLNEVDTAIVHVDLAARHEDRQLTTLDGYEANLSRDIAGVATSLQGTANALTLTAQGASTTLGTTNETIKGLQPLETALTGTSVSLSGLTDSVRARVDAPQVTKLLTDAQNIADSGTVIAQQTALVTTDIRKEADELAKPQPIWKAIIPGAELGAKLYACAVNHICVN